MNNFILSSQNALEYVTAQGLSELLELSQVQIQPKPAKKFQLITNFTGRRAITGQARALSKER